MPSWDVAPSGDGHFCSRRWTQMNSEAQITSVAIHEITMRLDSGLTDAPQYVNVSAPSPAKSISGDAPFSSAFSTSSSSLRSRSLKQIGQT